MIHIHTIKIFLLCERINTWQNFYTKFAIQRLNVTSKNEDISVDFPITYTECNISIVWYIEFNRPRDIVRVIRRKRINIPTSRLRRTSKLSLYCRNEIMPVVKSRRNIRAVNIRGMRSNRCNAPSDLWKF